MKLRVVTAVAVVALTCIPLAADAALVDTSGSVDPERDCTEAVPAAIDTEVQATEVVGLNVLVLLDGISQARAREVMTRAEDAYSPAGIDVRPVYRKITIPADEHIETPEYPEGNETIDFVIAFERVKAALGGRRPAGFDLVHLLTDKDIYQKGVAGTAVAGVADCVGGVRFPERAFSMSEANPKSTYEDMVADMGAKVAAHEIGHLLGGQHHHSDCLTGDRQPNPSGRPAMCTLMSPGTAMTFSMQAINMNPVESRVMRGHVTQFAGP